MLHYRSINNESGLTAAAQARNAEPRKNRVSASRKEAAYDAGLVVRFNGGDETAFNEIVSRHRANLFAVALRILRNRGDAEEIVQDAFMRAHRGLVGFRGDSSLATWLHHIAINLSRNRYGYFMRRRRYDTLSLDCPLRTHDIEMGTVLSDCIPCDAPTAARAAVSSEFTELVTVCMGKLASWQRDILTMRAVLNRSYDEIGRDLGLNVGTVKSRIARARGCLRAHLIELCPEFGAETSPTNWFETGR